jgi:DNA-binding MarR family transcriptional regulator
VAEGLARPARALLRRPAAGADAETRAARSDHAALRLWLRLFTCSFMVERRIRARLRERFGTTLARFDYLAQLARSPHGLRMRELSERLMVTGGNVTGLTRELVGEGLVERRAVAADRRVQMVRLTARGRRAFDAMAAAHEGWVVELLAALEADERDRLFALLGRFKAAVARHDRRPEEDA